MEHELTTKQVSGRHKQPFRIDPERFYAYLQHKWRNKPDALTSREITEMIGVSNQHNAGYINTPTKARRPSRGGEN